MGWTFGRSKHGHSKQRPYVALVAIGGVVVSLTPGPARASAETPSAVRQAIQAAYTHIDFAAARKDAPGVFKRFASRYVQINPNGRKSTRAELERALPLVFAQLQSLESVTTVRGARMKGREVVASIVSRTVMKAADPKTNEIHTLVLEITAEDTWAKSPAGWLKVRGKTLSMTETVDGKLRQSKPSPSGSPSPRAPD